MPGSIDSAFLALPLRGLAAAALQRAQDLGASHADFRLERIRTGMLRLRDARLDTSVDHEDVGLSVRVVHEGTWGFAAGIARTTEAAAAVAEQAVATAKVARALRGDPVELAAEPVYDEVSWVSAYDLDPFDVPEAERIERLAELSERLLAADGVDHVDAAVTYVRENKFYADTAGTSTIQQRVRIEPEFTAVHVDRGAGSVRHDAHARAAGRARLGVPHRHRLGSSTPRSPSCRSCSPNTPTPPACEAGSYDLVIDPTNLWLTIHESIGHATELDRALGYEAAYAGTSFATPDKLGTLRYGSEVMNVTGDRVVEHGLATIGYDDEGVATQRFDIVRDGVLVGYQLNRHMARAESDSLGSDRSNGCAFADSAGHIPLQRMPNVSLQPAADGPSLDELISGVERGILIKGDKSWSIDMQRFNFQFTGQQFHRIENGRLVGQLRDVGVPGHDDRLLGVDGSGRRPADLRARRRAQLRQGPARAGRAGLARQPGRAVPRRQRAEHAPRRRATVSVPQEIAETALAASTADGCVVIAEEHSETNLRWAANALTTNGQMRTRSVTVISTFERAAGPSAGVVTAAVATLDEVAELVRASERAGRDAAPADDAVPLVEPYPHDDDWADEPAYTDVTVFARLRRRARSRVRAMAPSRPAAVRLRRAPADVVLPRVRRPDCGVASTSPTAGSSSTARPPTTPALRGRACTAAISPTSTRRTW